MATNSMQREAFCALLLTVFSRAAAMAASKASFAEERYKDHLSVSQQSEAANRTVKSMCAQAARAASKEKKDLEKNLQTENSKQKMGSSMNMALKHHPDLQSHCTAGKGMHVQPEAKSDALPMLAEEALRVSREPIVTAFRTQLPNPLLGSEPAVSLCATLASSTGKSRMIVLIYF